MAYSTPSDLRVLHALRLKGMAETDTLADLVALPDPQVVAALETFRAEGLVQRRDGRLSGWSLTPEGRAVAAQRIQDDLDASGKRDAVAGGYQAFIEANGTLLEVCTAWQMKDGGPMANDHTDERYDHKVVQSLVDVHGDAAPVCAALGDALDRFSPYGVRLYAALEKVLAGEGDWFAGPLLDSYHTVWFQLHEDLLVSLDIERGADT